MHRRRLQEDIHRPLARYGFAVLCVAALYAGITWLAIALGVLTWIAWRRPKRRKAKPPAPASPAARRTSRKESHR